ncbi:diguanylate cyclase, partial [Shewanella sp. 10N.286.45.A1]
VYRTLTEIPNMPVIFRESDTVTVSVKQGESKIIRASSPSQDSHKVMLSTPLVREPHCLSLVAADGKSVSWLKSPSFEILGGFREKVVSTFNSPF